MNIDVRRFGAHQRYFLIFDHLLSAVPNYVVFRRILAELLLILRMFACLRDGEEP